MMGLIDSRDEASLKCSNKIPRCQKRGTTLQEELHCGDQAEDAYLDGNPEIRSDAANVSHEIFQCS